MGSQYLIKQHLHAQPGGWDVHLTVHSTDWHTSRSLITCGDAGPLPQPAGATGRGGSTPIPPPVTHSLYNIPNLKKNEESKCKSIKT